MREVIALTLNLLKQALYDRFTAYWSGATIAWGATKKVKPVAPLVILQLGTVKRTTQPISQVINGVIFSAYPSEVPLQIDLYTRGNPVNTPNGSYTENTATNDLLDFVNFLDSPSTIEWSTANDVSILLAGGVQDLTDIISDTQWQYRAMVEMRVSFTQWAAEYNGVLSESCIIFGDDGTPTGIDASKWKQTASGGGGTGELAEAKTGAFDEIKPQFVNEQEDTDNG